MQLDSNTLIFSIGILSLLMSFITWTFPGALQERDYGLKTWSIGMLCVGASLILIFLRSRLHPFAGVFLANIFLMAGGALGLLAPSKFYQIAVPRKIYVGSLTLGIVGLLLHLLFTQSIVFAMIGVCLGMAIMMIYTAWLVIKRSHAQTPFAARVFAASMGLMGLAYLMRAALAMSTPNAPAAPVSLAGSHQSILIIGALFVVCSTMSFFALVQDEQKSEIAEKFKRDALTGLFNRRAFFEAAELLSTQQTAYSVLMVDIDHFKSINDTHGHLGGDVVLQQTGRLILNSFRLEDLSCRFGGEEFCIVFKDENLQHAKNAALNLLNCFKDLQIQLPDQQQISITISVGISKHVPGETLLKTIQRADEALYRSKKNGRNRVEVI
jgi:diguanylate cyclase (GGDEF)-like protein